MKEWEGQKRANQMVNLRLGGMAAYLRQKHVNCNYVHITVNLMMLIIIITDTYIPHDPYQRDVQKDEIFFICKYMK